MKVRDTNETECFNNKGFTNLAVACALGSLLEVMHHQGSKLIEHLYRFPLYFHHCEKYTIATSKQLKNSIFTNYIDCDHISRIFGKQMIFGLSAGVTSASI